MLRSSNVLCVHREAEKGTTFYRAMLCIRGTSHGPVSESVCLSQVGVLLKRLNESGWFLAWELHSTYPTLCYKEIHVPSKIRVLSSGILLQTLDLENFATASRRYTGDIHNSSVVGLFITDLRQWERLGRVMVECTQHDQHRPTFITHWLNLQLHTIDLVRTCRISSFCTVAWQLARFQLTRRIARSLGDSWASCLSCASLLILDINWRISSHILRNV